MSEEFEVLSLAVSRLETAGIEYMITDSFALAAHATPRMTRDIDVVIDCSPDQAAQLAESFQVDSYASVVAARAVTSRTMFNVIHNETLLKVDFIVRRMDAYTDEQFARRRRIELDGFNAWFISPEDLVLAKLLWRRETGSEQQLRDIRSVPASVLDLDQEHLAIWVGRLGLANEMKQVTAA
jgi:hypothetical protein